jgi:hypothetical protein
MTDDLDPSLAENADRMSARLDELTETRLEVPEKDIIEIRGPLEGYTKAPFFEPANAFSGQDLGLIEALYNVVNEAWTHADEHVYGFQSGMGQVLSKWSGNAATACGQYVGEMVGFVVNEQQCLFTLADGLATYAAIIQAGRESLNELMGACVSGWDQATRVGEIGTTSVAIAAITGITGLATGIATGGAALPPFMSAVGGVIGAAGNAQVALSGKHTDIANTYLKSSGDLVAQAVEAINASAVKHLNNARSGLPRLPTLPTGINDKGAFHPESQQPAQLTAGGTAPAARPSKIENTLD